MMNYLRGEAFVAEIWHCDVLGRIVNVYIPQSILQYLAVDLSTSIYEWSIIGGFRTQKTFTSKPQSYF